MATIYFYDETGQTLYAKPQPLVGAGGASWANDVINLTDADSIGAYSGTGADDAVDYVVFQQAGGSPDSSTDTPAYGFIPRTTLSVGSVTTDLQGTGADTCTVTLQDDLTNPIADADVWVTSDSAGNNVVAGTLQSDSAGQVTFLLDAGTTYYIWFQKDGTNGTFNKTGLEYVAVAD